jgi:hypothetical protein
MFCQQCTGASGVTTGQPARGTAMDQQDTTNTRTIARMNSVLSSSTLGSMVGDWRAPRWGSEEGRMQAREKEP